MASFEVKLQDGRTVDVDAPNAKAAAQGAAKWAKANPKASWGSDVARSAAQGLGKAFTGLAGGVGDARDVGQLLGNKLGGFLGADAEQQQRGAQTAQALSAFKPAPTSGELNRLTGLTYKPQTRTGKFSEAITQNAGAALIPGSAGVRAANVLLPAVVGEGAGQIAEGLGASEGVAAAARLGGSLVGAGLASVRPGARGEANMLRGQDRDRMAQQAAGFRQSGIEPTLVDVVDDAGRGTIRAAASRMTPGRQAATDFADARSLNLPDRMGRQARNIMSQDPRAPREIATDLAGARRTQGNTDFGAVRNERVALSNDAVQALRTEDGRSAIRDAAASSLRSLDPNERAVGAELNRMVGDVLDNPGGVQISVGMAQSISETLFDAADAAARSGRNRQAQSLGNLARAVRENASGSVPGYRTALDNYAAGSRLMEAADQGQDFLARNTDEFIAATPGPGAPGNDLARATARRAIERAAGENTSAAPGVARRIANAPEQQARNRALLGEQDANRLQTAMAGEERLVRNAQDIAPRSGSQTQLRTQDAANMLGTAGRAARGDWVGVAIDWLKSRGMNDRQAQALIEAATDPRRTDEIIRQLGEADAQRLMQIRNAASVGLLTAPRAQPE